MMDAIIIKNNTNGNNANTQEICGAPA